MAALGEEIHARGLKFGLYASPGRKTCARIYDRYPSDHLGSLGHEQTDADTMAEWGVDYLKYDWCRANRAGNDLRTMTEETRGVLTDPALLSIAMDPAGQQGQRTGRVGNLEFWRRDLTHGFALGILNRGRTGARLNEDLLRERIGNRIALDVTTGTQALDVELDPHEMRIWAISDSRAAG